MMSEWPRIQQALRRHRPDIGYVTLSLYGGNGGTTETVGRLDFDDRHLRHWLEHGVADDSEDQLMDVLAALGRSIPSQDPDDEYQIKSDDDEDDDEDNESEESDDADDEESEEDDEESEEPEEGPVPPLSNSQVEAATRRWLTTTCEQNCLDAGEASFRVRVYAHGGVKQLWSTLLRYQSTAAPPRPPASSPSPYTPASPQPALSPHMRSPQMSHPPGNNGSGDYPSPLLRTPSPVPQRPEQRSHNYAENFASQPQTGGIHAAEVETLHMVHGLIRSFAASVLNTAKEQQQVYQRIIGELAGSLSDARQHNTDLIAENNQVQRARMEQERELLEQTDKSRVKESLGREGLQQAGALIRAVIQAQAQGPRAQRAPAPAVEGPTQYPEVDDDGNVITSEPSEEQLMALSQWLHSRPDVVDTLLDGSVQEYLRNPQNVEQLRGLAAVMAGPPAESTPENTDNG